MEYLLNSCVKLFKSKNILTHLLSHTGKFSIQKALLCMNETVVVFKIWEFE